MRSILKVKAGEAVMSQTTKGCGSHAEEFRVYPEDSGATKGLLGREREDQIFVGGRSYSREQTGCPREESFSPLKNGAGTGSWSLAASSLPWSSLSGRVPFLPMTSPDT